MWAIRPKLQLVDEEDKENIKMKENIKAEATDYFDARGAPAPAPWEKEKRVAIEPMKAKDKVPPALKTDELCHVLAHLVKNAKDFKTDTPIFVPSRNDKNFPAQFGIMRFDKESGSHWLDSISAFSFDKRGDFDLEPHCPSNISLGEVLNEAFRFDAAQRRPYDSDTEVKFRSGQNLKFHVEWRYYSLLITHSVIDSWDLFSSATYNPFVEGTKVCEFKFEWVQSDGEILCHPIITQKSTSCRVKLQIDKTSSSPKLLEIRKNLNLLQKIMASVKGDCDLKGTNIDLKTVDGLIKSSKSLNIFFLLFKNYWGGWL